MMSDLRNAVRDREYEVVTQLLDKGADIDAGSGFFRRTPLHYAVEYQYDDDLKIVRLLLQRGSNIEAMDSSGVTPLFLASRRYNWVIVKLLVKKGAKYLKGCLHYACGFLGDIEVVKLFLEMGGSTEGEDDHGRTPLQVASSLGKLETMKVLIENGANVEAKDNYWKTSLHHATDTRGDFSNWNIPDFDFSFEGVVRELLQKGANIEAKENDGYTPLHYASLSGDCSMVELLVQNGANVKAENNYGETAKNLTDRKSMINLLEEYEERYEGSTKIQCLFRAMMAKNVSNKRRAEPDKLFDPEFSTIRKKLLMIDDSPFR